jgi:acetoin utilization protein AcuC
MVSAPVGLIHVENFREYDFGEGHPLTPLRIELTYALMRDLGILEHSNVKKLIPRKATDAEVLRIHSQKYIDKLKELNSLTRPSYKSFPEFGLGPGDNPVFPGMYDASLSVVGASLSAAEYLFIDEDHTRAFNIAGGLHHAMPDAASGFCILNDPAIAIQKVLDEHPDFSVMYLDIDCHHGDGVQWIFYKTPKVLTLSFHQSGETLFPGTGFTKETGEGDGKGYSLNFPFPARTFDDIYLRAFNRILPQVMDAYRPDLLVCQLGVDTHFLDPLTSMGLSTTGQEKVFQKIHECVPKYVSTNKLLALGGGGYDVSVVGRTWSMILAEMAGINLENYLPDSWLALLKEKASEFADIAYLRDKNWRIEEIQLKNSYFVDELEQKVDVVVEQFEHELIPQIKPKGRAV